jgi:uncharacterized repeat protein (TIGR01451 family)
VWAAANSGLGSLSILVIQGRGNQLFVGTTGGSFKSTNQGTNWSGADMAGQAVYGFEFHPANPQQVWAAAASGVYATTDGGTTWNRIGQTLTDVYTVARDTNGILYAGTKNNGIYRYNGAQWVAASLGATRIYSMLSAGAAPGRLVAGTANGIWVRETEPPTPTPTSTMRTPTLTSTPSRTSTRTPTPSPTPTWTPTPTPTPVPEIQIQLRNDPAGLVSYGDVITYTVDYRTTGSGIFHSVLITNSVPDNTTFVFGSIRPIAMGLEFGGVVTWTLGTLSSPQSGSVSYQAQVNDQSQTAVAVINEGAFVQWWPNGAERSNPVINGPHFYLPVILASP